MGSDGADRVNVRRPFLYPETLDRVCVVRAPYLRRIIEQSGVKTTAASRAAFKKHVGEFRSKALQQLIEPQNISVEDLALASCGKSMGINVAHTAVIIPFDVIDAILPYQL
jgi:hypothetical protein